VLFIAEGEAQCSVKTPNGTCSLVALGPGVAVGEASALAGSPQSVSVRALVRTTTMEISSAMLKKRVPKRFVDLIISQAAIKEDFMMARAKDALIMPTRASIPLRALQAAFMRDQLAGPPANSPSLTRKSTNTSVSSDLKVNSKRQWSVAAPSNSPPRRPNGLASRQLRPVANAASGAEVESFEKGDPAATRAKEARANFLDAILPKEPPPAPTQVPLVLEVIVTNRQQSLGEGVGIGGIRQQKFVKFTPSRSRLDTPSWDDTGGGNRARVENPGRGKEVSKRSSVPVSLPNIA